MAIPLVGSPAPATSYAQLLDANSSEFAASVGNWTSSAGAVTRDTTVGHRLGSRSASLKWASTTGGSYITCPVPGQFRAGVPVDLLIALKVEESSFVNPGRSYQVHLGDFVSGDTANTQAGIIYSRAPFSNLWRLFHVRWVPTAARTGVTIRVTRTLTDTNPETWHVGFAYVSRAPSVVGVPDSVSDTVIANSPLGAEGFNQWGRSRLWGADGEAGGYMTIGELGSDRATTLDEQAYVWLYPKDVNNTEMWLSAPHTVSGDRPGAGIDFNVGADYVGVYFSEFAADEMGIHPDFGDYWITLLDGDSGAATKGWRAADAAGNRTGLLSKSPIRHLAAAPGSPVAGEWYYDTVTNKARMYDGTAWYDLW